LALQYAHQCLTWKKEATNTVAMGDLATGTNTLKDPFRQWQKCLRKKFWWNHVWL